MKDLPHRRESPILDEIDEVPEIKTPVQEVHAAIESDDETLSIDEQGPNVEFAGDSTEPESEEEDFEGRFDFDEAFERKMVQKLNRKSCDAKRERDGNQG